MARFIIRRLLSIIPTMFIIVTLSFFLIRFAPGGPFSSEKKLPEQVLENILKKYHMDEPMPQQYLRYLGEVVRGDLGPSFRYQDQTVNELIARTMPVSIILGTTALALALFLGMTAGVISALRQNKWPDYLSMSVAVVGISIPLFVIGPVLQLIFAMKLNILPTSGWINSRAGLKTIILPMATLAFPYFAYIARMSRGSVLEVLRSDYIRTARSKGLKESVVIVKHVLKGAMLPIVSYMGPAFSGIITGSVVVETVFVVPGVGNIFVQSALNRDYTLIMGDIIVYSAILVAMNFLVDIVYGFLDPRIAYK
ncbi:MAG: ABC transporter [Treponema sp. GWB1_62_6]|nr:MAG: ABC transporter [Treponema sp. GWB1_62_6]OHE69576.1 MAG: ABC transporter [Treponema sp. GWC1_61_84]OHE76832.1 MAG: ABC transporter [Treponema sp. RIFOXYC1_FULL_61_9]HCM26946.1 oligopeptide ABC transporter permease OppB [Treponema sp.]